MGSVIGALRDQTALNIRERAGGRKQKRVRRPEHSTDDPCDTLRDGSLTRIVLLHGAKAPSLIVEHDLKKMKPGDLTSQLGTTCLSSSKKLVGLANLVGTRQVRF